MPNLNQTEALVAETITEMEDLTTSTPIKEVAGAADVSEAMVVKVAKKLGFAGFRELRASLVEYRNAPTSALYSEISPDDDLEEISAKVFRTSIQALEETLAILDPQVLAQAVDLLVTANNVDFYGVGGSAQIARDVSHKFLRIGRRANVFDDPHMMLMSSAVLKRGDVVVAFSHSGTTDAVIAASELARSNGAQIIALTNYTGSPLANMADIVLNSTARGGPLLGENAGARIAQLNIFDVVFVAIAQHDAERARSSLDRTMDAVQPKRRK